MLACKDFVFKRIYTVLIQLLDFIRNVLSLSLCLTLYLSSLKALKSYSLPVT